MVTVIRRVDITFYVVRIIFAASSLVDYAAEQEFLAVTAIPIFAIPILVCISCQPMRRWRSGRNAPYGWVMRMP